MEIFSSFTFFNFITLLMPLNLVPASANFSDIFVPIWAADHIINQGDKVFLTLDNTTGCGFVSKQNYLYGKVGAQIKLVPNDSAGTVTAFYLSSDGWHHDELDFEFLGNESGQPYLVQTNVFANGTGNREQRHSLWFDPTTDFHNYSFFWNHNYIIFQVDEVPIRVFENKESKGVPYLNSQAMGIHGSLWNGEDWATKGGLVKTNWSNSPFIATFGSFEVDACVLSSNDPLLKCGKKSQFWWDKSVNKKLNKKKKKQIKSVQNKYLVYDYCKDTARFTQIPRECIG